MLVRIAPVGFSGVVCWEGFPNPQCLWLFMFCWCAPVRPVPHGEGFALRTRKRVSDMCYAYGTCLACTRAAMVAIGKVAVANSECGGVLASPAT
jgi:hypothetical protein